VPQSSSHLLHQGAWPVGEVPPSDCFCAENACLLLPGSLRLTGGGASLCIPVHPSAALCRPDATFLSRSTATTTNPTPHHTLAPCNQTNPNPRRLGHGAPLDRSQGQQGARSSATARQATAAGGLANYLTRMRLLSGCRWRDAPMDGKTRRRDAAARPSQPTQIDTSRSSINTSPCPLPCGRNLGIDGGHPATRSGQVSQPAMLHDGGPGIPCHRPMSPFCGHVYLPSGRIRSRPWCC